MDNIVRSLFILKISEFNISKPTRNRHIKSGLIPAPDFPAQTLGGLNKWLKTTIDNLFRESLKK